MGLVDGVTGSINGARDYVNQKLSLDKNTNPPFPTPDFPEGFQFVEIVNGSEQNGDKVALIGNLMPFQPFEFGGEQRIQKDFYPGNSEPTIQVLNPQEDDVVVRGRFKDKLYKDPIARGVAEELQKQIDGIRIRGNLVKISMGEWRRYGFLQKTAFKLKTNADIDYELTFLIVGFNPPRQCSIVSTQKAVPIEINKDLLSQLGSFQAQADQIPSTVPQSIADVINDAVSDVAGAVSAVTGFVDDVLSQVEDVTTALSRAAGLVRHAEGEIVRFKQRIGRISYSLSSLTGSTASNRYTSTAFMATTQSSGNDLMSFLAQLRSRFAQLVATTPLARYRVKDGDTLQRIANRFYADPEQWELIYDHNSLTSTDLENGIVIEIPRL